MSALYAVCTACAHVEPRPDHAGEDWQRCENCDAANPDLLRTIEAAEDASERVLAFLDRRRAKK